ncbi:PTI1-like tyrosine-protein kinase At3g15890 [Phalaenopsis equestris]|uniref:PTI1-like tyrosine-protein kinase At3g15890 n=1 Tax=Phalaenopsis equestris TaxID=78828 RepID=UPI0009E41FCD|nr:PTI1-like tyrosine-protein kinase At3g15890 [Phalaenopsis equestris]
MMKLLCCTSRGENESSNNLLGSSGSHEFPWEVFRLKDILHATNNFHDDYKLGEGGFGTVYWGRIGDGSEIAVKRLKTMTAKSEMEFIVEVEVLGRVRHKNLLGLRGYFAGGNERLIIYDYMPNRSLLSHLHGHFLADAPLDWQTRMRIAVGSAKGIACLHHEANPHIIHRDIKASNVLLDSKFRPKVADFGFAKLIPDDVSHVTTRVKGTLGYLAPEYAMWGKVSESCDVYSFGILLFEIVSGRKPIERLPAGKKRDILQWARPLMEQGNWEQLADQRMGGRVDRAQLQSVLFLALKCTDRDPDNRPPMKEVVEVLRGGDGLRMRPKEVGSSKGEEEEEEEGGLADALSCSVDRNAAVEMR